MRLIFALFFVASGLHAATLKPSVKFIYFDDRICASKTDDPSPTNADLTEIGTVPYGTGSNPPAGNSAAGPFTTSNYFRELSGALIAAMTATSGTYSVSVNVNVTTFAGQNTALSQGPSQMFYGLFTDGTLRWAGNSFFENGTAATTTNTWHNLGFSWNGTTRKYYKDGVLDTSTATSATWVATGNVYVGLYAGGSVPLQGTMNSLIGTNTVETVFPIDPFVAVINTDKRGLSLKSVMRLSNKP